MKPPVPFNISDVSGVLVAVLAKIDLTIKVNRWLIDTSKSQFMLIYQIVPENRHILLCEKP